MGIKSDLEVLAWDLDDTLIPTFEKGLVVYGNRVFGTNCKFEDFTNFFPWEVFKILRGEFLEMLNCFYKSQDFENLRPYPEAQSVVKNLSKVKYQILITARPVFLQKETEEFVEEYFPEIKKVICNGNKTCSNHSKLNFCLENNVQYLTDDRGETISECSDSGIKCYFPKRPWNKYLWANGRQEKKIIPVNNLLEVQEDIFKNGNYR
ncbi:MAG: hypothetical protein PVJ67_03195 [Candidatus Pacearchaeota archaeon]|jgi:5'(3')-deoxyribonucleotidase